MKKKSIITLLVTLAILAALFGYNFVQELTQENNQRYNQQARSVFSMAYGSILNYTKVNGECPRTLDDLGSALGSSYNQFLEYSITQNEEFCKLVVRYKSHKNDAASPDSDIVEVLNPSFQS